MLDSLVLWKEVVLLMDMATSYLVCLLNLLFQYFLKCVLKF